MKKQKENPEILLLIIIFLLAFIVLFNMALFYMDYGDKQNDLSEFEPLYSSIGNENYTSVNSSETFLINKYSYKVYYPLHEGIIYNDAIFFDSDGTIAVFEGNCWRKEILIDEIKKNVLICEDNKGEEK